MVKKQRLSSEKILTSVAEQAIEMQKKRQEMQLIKLSGKLAGQMAGKVYNLKKKHATPYKNGGFHNIETCFIEKLL